MLIINVGQSFRTDLKPAFEGAVAEPIEVFDLEGEYDVNRPLSKQVVELVNKVPLSPQQWGQTSLMVYAPTPIVFASAVVAEMHGRMGYFPTACHTRELPNGHAYFEFVNLQEVRNQARTRR